MTCICAFSQCGPRIWKLLAHQLTEINGMRCAVGAFDADRLIGVANYVVSSDDPQVAEVAIAVAHDDHRVGVGTALLEYLGEIAISCGIRRFTADALATNHLMLQLLSDAGGPRQRLSENGQVLHFQIELPRHPMSAIGIARRRVFADRKDKRVRHRPNSAQHKGRNSGGA